jgi:hypothetical protein
VAFGVDVVVKQLQTAFFRVPKGMVLSDLSIRDISSGDIKIKATSTQDPVWRTPTARDIATGLVEITKEFPLFAYPSGNHYDWYDIEWGAFQTVLVHNANSYQAGSCWLGGTWTATPSHP